MVEGEIPAFEPVPAVLAPEPVTQEDVHPVERDRLLGADVAPERDHGRGPVGDARGPELRVMLLENHDPVPVLSGWIRTGEKSALRTRAG